MYIKASKASVTQANRPAGGHLAAKCHNGKIKKCVFSEKFAIDYWWLLRVAVKLLKHHS